MSNKKNKILLLNSSFLPIKTIGWERAFYLLFLEKAEVIQYYEDWNVRTIHKEYPVPSIMRLTTDVKLRNTKIKFSRKNIYRRDKNICQFCGQKYPDGDLTLDHVIPKSLGGKTNWTNIVSCCLKCNTKKANKTPQQANMKLLNKPVYPDMHHGSIIKYYLDESQIPKEWLSFL